jgi:hypothetical protein
VNGFKHVRIRQYIQRRCGHPPSGGVGNHLRYMGPYSSRAHEPRGESVKDVRNSPFIAVSGSAASRAASRGLPRGIQPLTSRRLKGCSVSMVGPGSCLALMTRSRAVEKDWAHKESGHMPRRPSAFAPNLIFPCKNPIFGPCSHSESVNEIVKFQN